MRRIVFLLLLAIPSISFAQVADPVKWSFTAKNLSTGNYEIHLTATIDKGWHLYSQTTPEGGALPTTISFAKNPLITLDGKVKEEGKVEKKYEEMFGMDVKQFSGKVDFVQIIQVKGNAKTAVVGEVESMTCNDKQCLPPKTVKFSVALK